MKQIPIFIGDDGKMRTKNGSMAIILVQLFVLSALVGALSLTVSATQNEADTTMSSPDFPEIPAGEEVGFERFDRVDGLELEFVPGELLVKFRTRISASLRKGIVTTGIASIDELNKRFETKAVKRVFSNIYKLTLPKDAKILSVAREYEADQSVEYAEPNYIMRTILVPNDTNYTQQWAHQTIESEYAWNTTTGDYNVVVAIVDTGVDWNHPDLATNIWNNTDEIPDNNEDDDNNGYVDDIRGWDFVNAPGFEVYPEEDYTEPDNDPMDFTGHGSTCAGIAAAVGNNSLGVAGVTWNCKIMAVRSGFAVYGGGALLLDQAAAGILYAADNGADIISMSFGGYGKSEVMYDAIKNASDEGVLLVAAAGNDATSEKHYPAAYEEVIAVSATDSADNPASFTNYGNWIEVAAPGVNILSTTCPNAPIGPYGLEYPYDYVGGTSSACPHVAGVAALVWSQFPNVTRHWVRLWLRHTAVDRGDPGFDVYYGYGRVNASGAVNQDVPDHDLLVWSWKLPFVSEPGDTAIVNTTVLNFGESTEENVCVKLLVNGTEVDSKNITTLTSGESATVSCSWTPMAEEKYNVTTYVVPVNGENVTENNAQSAHAWARYGRTVRVPEDITTIKEAVDTANLGIYYGDATVHVASGMYIEHDIVIENSLDTFALVGEDSSTTTIRPPLSWEQMVFVVRTSNVNITGFSIKYADIGVAIETDDNVISGNMFYRNNYGIYVVYSSGNVISGNTLSYGGRYLGHGIMLDYSSNNTVSGNVINGSLAAPYFFGIYLRSSSRNPITGNTVSDSEEDGIMVLGSNQNPISGNTISNNGYGITLGCSPENVLTNNSMTGNTYNFDVGGESLLDFIQDIDPSNTVDGKPMYYWVNQHDKQVPTDAGFVAIVNSTRITVKDLNPTKNYDSVVFAYTTDSIIEGVAASNNVDAIYLFQSSDNTISGNTLLDNTHGIWLKNASSNTIGGNTVSGSAGNGILLSEESNKNTISGNTVSDSGYYGIQLSESNNNTVNGNLVTDNWYGIEVWMSGDNVIKRNTISSNTWEGLCLKFSGWHGAPGNLIIRNTISYNGYGIYARYSNNDTIYHNNIINNTDQVYTYDSVNTWDNGYPSGGNYWSDYDGNDTYSGPYQNETGSDGIGDTPYDIDENNRDNYPLMQTVRPVTNIHTGLMYDSIQEAINAPETLNGHTIEVDSGTYYENVTVNKSLTILGENRDTTIIDGNKADRVIYVTASDVTIKGFTVRNGNHTDIWVDGDWCTIANNVISGITSDFRFSSGLWLGIYSSQSIVENNLIQNNRRGIWAHMSHWHTIANNTISDNSRGIILDQSAHNTLTNNTITFNTYGIAITDCTTENQISNNNISNNDRGIDLDHADNQLITYNTFSNNQYGIKASQSDNNVIHHNNFIDNSFQAKCTKSVNTWDDGSEGNYWSDYTGEDQNGDGIGDTPYVINSKNKDNYPLMEPWSPS